MPGLQCSKLVCKHERTAIGDHTEKSNLVAVAHPEEVRATYKKLFEWELTLKRPLWQLKRQYEGAAMKRMDDYRK